MPFARHCSQFAKIMNAMESNLIPVTRQGVVNDAVEVLRNGGVIALPTDTVYGLACVATSPASIKEMYKIKARDETKTMAIAVGRLQDFYQYTHVDHLPTNLLETILPGPVTLILKAMASRHLDKSLLQNGKVGVRIPDSQFIQDVCQMLNMPVALTSANVSGDPSPVQVQDFKSLWPLLGVVVDGGRIGHTENNSLGSTVVDLATPGFYTIIRAGMAETMTVELLRSFRLKPSE